VTYEDIVGALTGRYGNYQLAAAYREQLKARVQLIGESQQFSAAVKKLAHRAFVGFPVDFIHREAAHAYVVKVRDGEVNQHLLMGGDG
jgi:hypothetical protein